ncbi:hypothetical protein BaRGS_00013698 [Batillaria attramentaria]|uniref:Uncharacterized protein n=1 Tax=Batillaria attramentaria TaxID=370345 RepID=A0ABD0L6U3_9CAEN
MIQRIAPSLSRRKWPAQTPELCVVCLGSFYVLLVETQILYGAEARSAIFDSLPYVKKETDENSRLEEITKRLRLRFRNYLQVLRTNKITVENLYKFHVKQPITQQYDCCSIPCKDFKPESLYGCKINRQTSCDLIPPSIPKGSFNPGRNLTEVWRSNVQYFPSLKWQYFISVLGLHSEYPASSFRWLGDCHTPIAPRNRHACHNIHDTRHRTSLNAVVRSLIVLKFVGGTDPSSPYTYYEISGACPFQCSSRFKTCLLCIVVCLEEAVDGLTFAADFLGVGAMDITIGSQQAEAGDVCRSEHTKNSPSDIWWRRLVRVIKPSKGHRFYGAVQCSHKSSPTGSGSFLFLLHQPCLHFISNSHLALCGYWLAHLGVDSVLSLSLAPENFALAGNRWASSPCLVPITARRGPEL